MAEAVIDTLPAPAMTMVTWIPLPSIGEAVALVRGLVALGAEAVELTVAAALSAAAQAFPGILRQATGYPYESFVFLLAELTRPA